MTLRTVGQPISSTSSRGALSGEGIGSPSTLSLPPSSLFSLERQDAVIRFLESLVIFPPDDTASTLDSGNPSAPDFPQRGHGSIRLGALFNNPNDPE